VAAQLRGLHKIGVEGTGSYGSALARCLAEQDVPVLQVGRPKRQVRRRHGKTDVVDAIAGARAVLSGEATATPKSHDGPVECPRVLKIVQRSATKNRTQSLNQLRNLIATAPDELRSKLRGLKTTELLATCAAFRVAADDDSLAGITRLALLGAGPTCRAARGAVAPHRRAPGADHHGNGTGPDRHPRRRTGHRLHAAAVSGGQPAPLASESSWAALLGSNPIPASSGKTHRHRANRGGDRQANAALWRIAVVRMRSHPDTRTYIEKKIKEGKSKPEAIRCLKRYIAR